MSIETLYKNYKREKRCFIENHQFSAVALIIIIVIC